MKEIITGFVWVTCFAFTSSTCQAAMEEYAPVIELNTCSGPLKMPSPVMGDRCASGAYDTHKGIIYIDKNMPEARKTYAIDHEQGHHCWYNHLRPHQRNLYAYFHNKRPQIITEYSSYNVFENFAEMVALLPRGFVKNKKTPQARIASNCLPNAPK